MWEQVAAQTLGRAAGSSDSAAPARSGIERLAYSADGYTVSTGGSRASGASVAKVPDGLGGMVPAAGAALAQGVGAVAANPLPWAALAAGVVLVAVLMRRRKG